MKRKALLAVLATVSMFSLLPKTIDCVAGEGLDGKVLSVSGSTDTVGTYKESYRLFDVLPVKAVEVTVSPRKKLVPCGNAIGIKIETNGVMVVGTVEVMGGKSPVENAGLMEGDVILSVNGTQVSDTDDLRDCVSDCDGGSIEVEVRRDGKVKKINVEPVKNPLDNSYYIGAWVRDSTAGIGTMTWFDPETQEYGALGHSITDVDTGKMLDVSAGEIVQAEIVGAEKGSEGSPGLLAGNFLSYQGTLESNSEFGIRGVVENTWMLPSREAIEVAAPSEVKTGKAEIICCMDGTEPVSYKVEIEKVMNSPLWGEKNMIIKIIDSRILETTGGIVQGMSGSPILQNGRIVGAVTHVFVNDPTRGYGIFIENMLAEAEKIK